MTTTSDLDDLIARVTGARGADREIDARLHRAFTPDLRDTIADRLGWLVGGAHENPTCAPAYTASIDAALALVERRLPGWSWSMHSGPKGSLVYLCRDWNDDYAPTFRSREPPKTRVIFERQEPGPHTPPLAILLALLMAVRESARS